MGIVDKEQSVKDLLRAMDQCATGATVHKFANARAILRMAFDCYRLNPDDGSAEELDSATRNALRELATAVWSRRSCGTRT